MHFAQTDKGKAEAGQRKVSRAVGTGGGHEGMGALQFLKAPRTWGARGAFKF